MLIGGFKKVGSSFESATDTYTINVKDDTVVEGPALNTGREILACEKVVIDTKTFIFAIGGHDRSAGGPIGGPLNSVEILEVGTDTWKTGKYSSTSPFGL